MGMAELQLLEEQRMTYQVSLDDQKTQLERNKLGQFATPSALAHDILNYAKTLMGETPIRFLEPSIGTGSFYSALQANFLRNQISKAQGYEIDKRFVDASRRLWQGTSLDVEHADFTKLSPPAGEDEKFNLIISNPPYVRHHHLGAEDKSRLQAKVAGVLGCKLSRLAGLYCYFMGIAHHWMQEGSIAAWLIPSEFMDVNYGRAIKHYLKNKVTLLHIHRFNPDDVQFDDALVSSAVVWFRKAPPPPEHAAKFSYGGTMMSPSTIRSISQGGLSVDSKWTQIAQYGLAEEDHSPTIGDFFDVRRGLATGDNKFFIMTGDQAKERGIPPKFLTPILPSPRHLKISKIGSKKGGIPLLPKVSYLLDCRLEEKVVERKFPKLWAYLQSGIKQGVADRYLCSNRKIWYAQEQRPAPLLACTYIGRPKNKGDNPFRFILNQSEATITNTYLGIYPKPGVASTLMNSPDLAERLWQLLSSIPAEQLVKQGRVYGGGMYKLEPKELKKVRLRGLPKSLGEATLFS